VLTNTAGKVDALNLKQGGETLRLPKMQ